MNTIELSKLVDIEKTIMMSRKKNLTELLNKINGTTASNKKHDIYIVIFHELMVIDGQIKEKVSVKGYDKKNDETHSLEFYKWEDVLNFEIVEESINKFGMEFSLSKIVDSISEFEENKEDDMRKAFCEMLKSKKNNKKKNNILKEAYNFANGLIKTVYGEEDNFIQIVEINNKRIKQITKLLS